MGYYGKVTSGDRLKLAKFAYAGPDAEVTLTASSVMSAGSILTMESPGANTSWKLEFLGPSLKCEKANESTKRRFLANFIKTLAREANQDFCINPDRAYYAWSPKVGRNGTSDLPFHDLHAGSPRFVPGSLISKHSNEAISAPVLYMMTFPDVYRKAGWAPCDSDMNEYDGSIVKCSLFNSTYVVSFNYTDGFQNVSVEIPYVQDEPQDSIVWDMVIPELESGGTVACPDLSSRTDFQWGRPLYEGNDVSATASHECGLFNRKLLRALSYQAVFDAFSYPLKGVTGVALSTSRGECPVSSSITETSLINTKELAFLTKIRGIKQYSGSFTQALRRLDDPNIQGLLRAEEVASNKSLDEALETLFQNVVVSLMSSSSLR